MFPDNVPNPTELGELLTAQSQYPMVTASLFNAVIDEAPSRCHVCGNSIGGEALSASSTPRSHCAETKIINGYGPTESTTLPVVILSRVNR
jgi:non-ribosomal peptide synthetase component F